MEYLSQLSSIIIAIAGLAGAILGIQKFFDTYTEKGKKRKETKQSKWDIRITKLATEVSDATAARVMKDFYSKQEEMCGEIYARLDDTTLRLEEVENINRAQTDMFKLTNKKIDTNEIDRIRHEILYFASQCHKGQEFGIEDFNHIFNIHDKYEALLAANDMKNGQMDIEYKCITDYYERLSRDGKL